MFLFSIGSGFVCAQGCAGCASFETSFGVYVAPKVWGTYWALVAFLLLVIFAAWAYMSGWPKK